MKIFLDDIRKTVEEGWTDVPTAQNCVNLLNEGKVTHLSLDHDLGGDVTGYDVLLWLERRIVEDPEFPIPTIFIHTANPVGRQKMVAALKSIHKLRKLNETDDKETEDGHK